MSKQKKIVNFGMMIAGAVFIFNPFVSLFDFLPDFIGYILLASSVYGLIDMLPYFDEARNGFLRLMWISITKFPVMLLASSIAGSSPDDMTIYLVFSFSYAILELIYIFPTFKSFFSAMQYLGDRYNSDSVSVMPTRHGGTKPVSALVNITLVMMCVRSVMSVLPDVCLLYLYDNSGEQTPITRAIYNFRPVAMVICGVIALLFGIFWLVKFIQYMNAVRTDHALAALIEQKYDAEVAPLTGKRIYRTICSAMTVFCVGVAASTDIVVDNINVLPDVLFGALMFATAIMLRKLTTKAKPLIYVSIAYTAVAAIAGTVTYNFYMDYGYLLLGQPEANLAYRWVIVASGCESALAIIMIVLLYGVLSDTIKKYTGHIEEGFTSMDAISKMKRSLMRSNTAFAVVGIITAIASAVYTAILSITETVGADPEMVTGGELVIPKYSYSSIFMIAFSIIWFICALALANAIKNQAEEKYVFFGAKK